MKIKAITKEEQEAKLKAKLSKRKPKKVKPSFGEWLMHDKFAFRVIYLLGGLSGLLVMVALLTVSLVFDFHITFQILFAALAIWQGFSAYKMFKNRKYVNSSMNTVAYKGKHNSPYYKKEASAQ